MNQNSSLLEREGDGTYTDEELSYENNPIAQVMGKPRGTARQRLYEAVAHYGLRQLFGEHFDTFLDNVLSGSYTFYNLTSVAYKAVNVYSK